MKPKEICSLEAAVTKVKIDSEFIQKRFEQEGSVNLKTGQQKLITLRPETKKDWRKSDLNWGDSDTNKQTNQES